MPTGRQHQQLDHGPLFRRGELDRALFQSDFERSQERDLHRANIRRPICTLPVGSQSGRAQGSALVYRAYTRAATRAQPSRQSLNNYDPRKKPRPSRPVLRAEGANE